MPGAVSSRFQMTQVVAVVSSFVGTGRRGSHQFLRPISGIAADTSSERLIVAYNPCGIDPLPRSFRQ